MKNLRLLAPLVVLASLAGCGGGGHHSSDDSPLAGIYTGTYASKSVDDQHGTLAFTVASDGTVGGTVNDSVSGSGTLASSTLAKSGAVALTFAFSGIAQNFEGTLSRSGSTYSGTINKQNGDIPIPFSVTLTRTGT